MKNPPRKKSKFKCHQCDRQLWMYLGENKTYETKCVKSEHTGNRFCWPGEGCFKS